MYIIEDFEINRIHPKFLSLLLTGKTRIGETERGSLKNRKLCIFRYSKIVSNIKLSLTYSELTVHMQNQL